MKITQKEVFTVDHAEKKNKKNDEQFIFSP